MKRQLKVFAETQAREAIRAKHEFLNRTYLGSVPTQISYKALQLINEEYKIARASIPNLNRAERPLKPCNKCTAPLQFGIPCRHKILGLIFQIHEISSYGDVHPHWHLQITLVSSYLSHFYSVANCNRINQIPTLESVILRSARSREGGRRTPPAVMPLQHAVTALV